MESDFDESDYKYYSDASVPAQSKPKSKFKPVVQKTKPLPPIPPKSTPTPSYESYEVIKEKIEKEFFWCREGCYYRINKDGIARPYKREALVTDLKPYRFRRGEETVDFFSAWQVDMNRRTYESVVFEPNEAAVSPSDFNLFTGFKWKPEGEINMEYIMPFIDLLSDMVNGVQEHLEFFLDWLSWIVQTPWKKTNVAILLYSRKQGVGKNTIIEYIERLLGYDYTAKLGTAEDIGAKFNSLYARKLFIYGDEINAKARKLTDIVKNAITETRSRIEEKYQEAKMVSNYSNYMFTTNNPSTFKIEQSDRRWFAVECDLAGERDCSLVLELLEREEAIQSLYLYLKKREIVNVARGKLVPVMTEYKQELLSESLPAYEQYLFDCYNDMLSFTGKRTILIKDFHARVNEYAEKKHLQKVCDSKTIPSWIRSELSEIATIERAKGGMRISWVEEDVIYEFLRKRNPSRAFDK